jgi:predicted transcriptional regulator
MEEVDIARLRSNKNENERIIMRFLLKNDANISQVARASNLHVKTAREVLIRLEKKGVIKLKNIDKFQSKIYGVT